MLFRPRKLIACCLLAMVAIMGCGYGPVSDTAYQYAKALYSLSNRQSADRVETVRQQIVAAQDSGQLSSREANWLFDICDDCQAEQWKAASQAARRMMEDQVDH